MISTTTPSVEGRSVKKYLGIVAGEAIVGANVFKDLFASVRNFVGGRSRAYEEELEQARANALGELMDHARMLGANAVISVSLDYEVITAGSSSMLMVCATGTAVLLDN